MGLMKPTNFKKTSIFFQKLQSMRNEEKLKMDSQQNAFCGTKLFSVVKQYNDEITDVAWCHLSCALWTPEIEVSHDKNQSRIKSNSVNRH